MEQKLKGANMIDGALAFAIIVRTLSKSLVDLANAYTAMKKADK